MSRRRRSIMSEQLKEQIAQELGFADTLHREGFEGVSSQNCGNMVKAAIQLAERNMMGTRS
ncbi:MAG: protein sspF [Desulfitobacterium hafniense]|nr:protein sspF [Desulfitobacterium hafniense]